MIGLGNAVGNAMACVYVLYSHNKDKFYVGATREKDASKRVKEHNFGQTKSTKHSRPWIIVHDEYFDDYTQARKRENYLKSGRGRKWIKEKFKNRYCITSSGEMAEWSNAADC